MCEIQNGIFKLISSDFRFWILCFYKRLAVWRQLQLIPINYKLISRRSAIVCCAYWPKHWSHFDVIKCCEEAQQATLESTHNFFFLLFFPISHHDCSRTSAGTTHLFSEFFFCCYWICLFWLSCVVIVFNGFRAQHHRNMVVHINSLIAFHL